MPNLAKELTLYGLIMVAIGSCIGSGIFVTPSQIAGLIPSSGLILLVWALGGLIALTGALYIGSSVTLPESRRNIWVSSEAYGGLAWVPVWLGISCNHHLGSIAVLSLAFTIILAFLSRWIIHGK